MQSILWVLEALSPYSGSVTAIAAIVALFVLPLQLRSLATQEKHQNKAMELSHYAEYTKRYQSILLCLPSDVGKQSFDFAKLSPQSKELFLRNMRSYFDLCYEEWELNERGRIEPGWWRVWDEGINVSMKRSAFQHAWRYFSDSDSEYGDEFLRYMNEVQKNDAQVAR